MSNNGRPVRHGLQVIQGHWNWHHSTDHIRYDFLSVRHCTYILDIWRWRIQWSSNHRSLAVQIYARFVHRRNLQNQSCLFCSVFETWPRNRQRMMNWRMLDRQTLASIEYLVLKGGQQWTARRNITTRVLGAGSLFSTVPPSPLPLSVAASLPRLFLPFFPDAGAAGVVPLPLLAETGSCRETWRIDARSDMQPKLISENVFSFESNILPGVESHTANTCNYSHQLAAAVVKKHIHLSVWWVIITTKRSAETQTDRRQGGVSSGKNLFLPKLRFKPVKKL